MNLKALFSAIPQLESDRLLLRAIAPDDAAGILRIYGDPEVGKYNCWTGVDNQQAAAQKIDGFAHQFQAEKRVRWGLFSKASGELIGDLAIVMIDDRTDRGELGFNLAQPFWGNGYMKEAIDNLLPYTFHTIGFNRIEAIVDPENKASRRLLEKLNFEEEATLKAIGKVNGVYKDMLLISLLRSDYAKYNIP